jgi:hypothetical protein
MWGLYECGLRQKSYGVFSNGREIHRVFTNLYHYIHSWIYFTVSLRSISILSSPQLPDFQVVSSIFLLECTFLYLFTAMEWLCALCDSEAELWVIHKLIIVWLWCRVFCGIICVIQKLSFLWYNLGDSEAELCVIQKLSFVWFRSWALCDSEAELFVV